MHENVDIKIKILKQKELHSNCMIATV